MSASLVGSEMCIRDRVHRVREGCAAAHQARSVAQQRIRSTPKRGCEMPVSYTHLTLPTICSV
eukprot:13835985-Alexandrium_andersonii.AAC.1